MSLRRTTGRVLEALALCGLTMLFFCACAGPDRPRCTAGDADAASVRAFPHHALLAEHLDALSARIADPSMAPIDIATAVDDYLRALPQGARSLGRATMLVEAEMAGDDFVLFCAGSARLLMASHQALDAALADLSARDAVSSVYVAHAVRGWLEGGGL